MSDTIIYTDTITINVNLSGASSAILDRILGHLQAESFTPLVKVDTDYPTHGDQDVAVFNPDSGTVSFPLSYGAISSLQYGDRVQWDGTRLHFTGTIMEAVYGAFDSDQDKDVLVVRVKRDDTGGIVKLNLAADHRGTLTLLT